MSTLTQLPAKIIAGDTLKFTQSASDYPASAGWSLRYVLNGSAGIITITSTASGADHLFIIASAVTSGWGAGLYAWTCYAVSGVERYTLLTGQVSILPDPALTTATDARSTLQIRYDAIKAVLEGDATPEQRRFKMPDGVEIDKAPGNELISEYLRLRGLIKLERQAEQVANGKNSGRKIVTRFAR